MHAKILSKNKIQDKGIFAQTTITQPPIDVDEWNFAVMSTAATEIDHLTKVDKNNKFKVAAAAI